MTNRFEHAPRAAPRKGSEGSSRRRRADFFRHLLCRACLTFVLAGSRACMHSEIWWAMSQSLWACLLVLLSIVADGNEISSLAIELPDNWGSHRLDGQTGKGSWLTWGQKKLYWSREEALLINNWTIRSPEGEHHSMLQSKVAPITGACFSEFNSLPRKRITMYWL